MALWLCGLEALNVYNDCWWPPFVKLNIKITTIIKPTNSSGTNKQQTHINSNEWIAFEATTLTELYWLNKIHPGPWVQMINAKKK